MTDSETVTHQAPPQPFMPSSAPVGLAQAVVASAETKAARAAAIDAAIAAWVAGDLANSPVSQSTAAWNHMVSALPHLTAALKELL